MSQFVVFCGGRCELTQVVLEAVAGLVGVGEAGVKRSRSVALDLILDVLSHRQSLGCTSELFEWCQIKCSFNRKTEDK